MITVYGRTNSSNVQLVMWMIAELGIKHTRHDFGFGYESTESDEYLAKNPMALVPVIEDGDVCMFESAAILRYLASKYGNDEFWPKDEAKRAHLDVWAEWGKNTFSNGIMGVFVYEVRMLPETRDPEIFKQAVAKLIPLAKILNDRIGEGPWLAGSSFTFADIACGYVLHRYFTLDWERPDLVHLSAYYERLQKREAYRKHVMVSYEDLRGAYLI